MNTTLLTQVKDILNTYTERYPFFGGCTYVLPQGEVRTIHYPHTEVESSLVPYIEGHPDNHQVRVIY